MDHDLEQAGDAGLVLAVGRWRQDAPAEIYRRHAGAVMALGRRLLTSRGEADEIVQEVFPRLWRQPDRFDPRSSSPGS